LCCLVLCCAVSSCFVCCVVVLCYLSCLVLSCLVLILSCLALALVPCFARTRTRRKAQEEGTGVVLFPKKILKKELLSMPEDETIAS
jgi:hypothetical protein